MLARTALISVCMMIGGFGLLGVMAEDKSDPVSFLIFGDSGYHHDYLDPKNYYKRARTRQQHQAFYYLRWLQKDRSFEDFKAPLGVYVPAIDGYVDASGLYPVAFGNDSLLRDQCM